MGKGRIVVVSDSPIIGTADCGVEFIPFPDISGKEQEIVAIRAASRITFRLGVGDVVFLQHNAGDIASGGPVPAGVVTDLIPFDKIAKITGETIEEIKKRLIVFATTTEEAEDGMPVIDLPYLEPGLEPEEANDGTPVVSTSSNPEPRDIRLPWSVLEMRQHHPLSMIVRLAQEVTSG